MTFTRCGLVASLLLAGLGCSSSSDNTGSGGTGGANANGGASNTSGGVSANGGGTATNGGAASGGSASGGAANGGSGTTAAPASASQADIAAFLDSGAYKNTPWLADVSAPRPATAGSQHGDGVRVWENAALVASMKAGRDGLSGRTPPDVGSMAVKELYDDTGKLVGIAAALRNKDVASWDGWTYYCYGPSPRCVGSDTPKSTPIYGVGITSTASGCAICHNGGIFTKTP